MFERVGYGWRFGCMAAGPTSRSGKTAQPMRGDEHGDPPGGRDGEAEADISDDRRRGPHNEARTAMHKRRQHQFTPLRTSFAGCVPKSVQKTHVGPGIDRPTDALLGDSKTRSTRQESEPICDTVGNRFKVMT